MNDRAYAVEVFRTWFIGMLLGLALLLASSVFGPPEAPPPKSRDSAQMTGVRE